MTDPSLDRMMVDRLDGAMEIARGPGTRVSVRIMP